MAQRGTVVFSSDPLVGHKQLYNNGADTHFSVHPTSGAFPTTRYKVISATAGFTLRNASWATIEIWAHSMHLGNFGEAGTNGERACGLTAGFDYKALSQVDFYGGSDGSQLASGSTVTVTVVWELTDMPSTVAITSAADAGTAVTARLSVQIAGYRHRLTYTMGGKSITADLAPGVSSHKQVIPLSWCEALPTAVHGSASVTVASYDGTRLIGTRSANFTIRVPAAVVPSVTAFDARPTNQCFGLTLQGISGLRLTASAEGAQGSTIQSIRFDADGRSVAGSPADFPKIQASGSVEVTVTVTDSRGRTAKQTRQTVVTTYTPPELLGAEQERCDADGTPNHKGDHVRWRAQTQFSTVGGNALTLRIERKLQDGWEQLYDAAPQADWSLLTQTFDIKTAYSLRYTLRDEVTAAQPLIMPIKTGYTFMQWLAAIKSFGFGVYPQHENSFELDPDTSFWTHGQEIQQLIQSAITAAAPSIRLQTLQQLYPINAIYISLNETAPNILLGFGTWERIKGRFLFGADETHQAWAVGGELTHTLTVNELPSHDHPQKGVHPGVSTSGQLGTYPVRIEADKKPNWDANRTSKTGGGKPFDKMPPYIAVYIWRRTA